MSVDTQMQVHGFAEWRTLNGVRGFFKEYQAGAVRRLVVLPVHGKSVLDPRDKILACYFDSSGQMCSDRFYETLGEFLEAHGLDVSRLAAPVRRRRRVPSLFSKLHSFGVFSRRLLFARG